MNIVTIPDRLDELSPYIHAKVQELTDIVASQVNLLSDDVPLTPRFSPGSAISNAGLTWIAQGIRTQIPYTLYLRGTSMEYQLEALKSGLISWKRVDDWFEDDKWLIASYRVPMWANHLSNEEFLTRLFLTVTSSIRYALTHALMTRDRIGLILFTPNVLNTSSAWDIHSSLTSSHFPAVTRGISAEYVKIWNQIYPVFPENKIEHAFSWELSKNNYFVLSMLGFSKDLDFPYTPIGKTSSTQEMDTRSKYLQTFWLIATVVFLSEISKWIPPSQELKPHI